MTLIVLLVAFAAMNRFVGALVGRRLAVGSWSAFVRAAAGSRLVTAARGGTVEVVGGVHAVVLRQGPIEVTLRTRVDPPRPRLADGPLQLVVGLGVVCTLVELAVVGRAVDGAPFAPTLGALWRGLVGAMSLVGLYAAGLPLRALWDAPPAASSLQTRPRGLAEDVLIEPAARWDVVRADLVVDRGPLDRAARITGAPARLRALLDAPTRAAVTRLATLGGEVADGAVEALLDPSRQDVDVVLDAVVEVTQALERRAGVDVVEGLTEVVRDDPEEAVRALALGELERSVAPVEVRAAVVEDLGLPTGPVAAVAEGLRAGSALEVRATCWWLAAGPALPGWATLVPLLRELVDTHREGAVREAAEGAIVGLQARAGHEARGALSLVGGGAMGGLSEAPEVGAPAEVVDAREVRARRSPTREG